MELYVGCAICLIEWMYIYNRNGKVTTLNMILKCHMVFYVTMLTFWMTFLVNKWTIIVTDDEWIHPLAQILPSLVNMDDWNLEKKTTW